MGNPIRPTAERQDQEMNDFPGSVALVANSDANIYMFRARLICRLRELGVIVYVIAPRGRFVANIEEIGAVFIPWELKRRGWNPLSALRQIIELVKIYRRLKVDLTHHFTIKPNLYGIIAARLAGIPAVFGGVMGLGYPFLGTGLVRWVLRRSVWLLYHQVLKLSDCITFETHNDFDTLLKADSLRTKGRVIQGGVGVDLTAFRPDAVSASDQERAKAELGIEPGMLVVSMISRLLYPKGVTYYIEAARLVRKRRPDVCFLLIGEPDQGNPESVTDKDIEAWSGERSVNYIGYRDDVTTILAVSDLLVHPTYYAEGIPKVLMEAAAMGKPIVTTKLPGIMQVVEDGVNGVLVPPRDVDKLVTAIEHILTEADVRDRYGSTGRRKVELEYSDQMVADEHIVEYRRVWMCVRPRRRREKHHWSQNTRTHPPKTYHPSVSVIIPARNAEATIAETLDSVLIQEYAGAVEVIVADGSDTPATAEIVRRQYPSVRLIPNPSQLTVSGLVAALQIATGRVIVRCDAHTWFPRGYIRRAIETQVRTGAANVGGRQQPVGTTFFERSVAIGMTTPLGAGDAHYRLGGFAGPVDTVFLGTFRREVMDAVGGYDPTLYGNEDYELNYRLRERGETVWFDPNLVVTYHPRSTLRALAKQYFNYGRMKAQVWRRHPYSLQPRHFAAPLIVLGLVLSAGLAVAGSAWAAVMPLAYLLILGVGALAVGLRRRTFATLLLPLVLATMHLTWGLGFFLPLARAVKSRTVNDRHVDETTNGPYP